MDYYDLDLAMFGESNTNVTTDAALSGEMKTYYADYLIDNAAPKLVHDQFGQQRPIPQNSGKTVEFRKYNPLPKLTSQISEGVTPDGQKLQVTTVSAEVKQYGGYVELSDLLQLSAIDKTLLETTRLIGSQAGRSLDTITREVLAGGTSVQYGEDAVAARYLLTGGEASGNHYLTVDCIRRAVRYLKNMNADTIDGCYVGIIHPDVSYDLMNDSRWVNVKSYADPEGIYAGEIGRIENVRFVESTEAKVFHAPDLASDSRNLAVSADASASTSVSFSGGTVEENALVGRKVIIGDKLCTVTANTASALTLDTAVTCSSGTVIYPGEAGAKGRDVYATLILGANAYGVSEIKGGGLQHIVKQLGSAGTGDPLDQRATVGWKATKAAVRLVEAFMRRIETCGTYEAGAN